MKKTIQITDDDGVVRVDKFLATKFPEYSRAAIAKLFTFKLIKLKGESIQPGFKLRPGAVIEYDLSPLAKKPEVIKLPVVHEDDDIVVVDKPAGIISHARGKFWQEASVASFIRDKIQGMDGERGGIVHRLDRATSGIMICAKNEVTLKHLQNHKRLQAALFYLFHESGVTLPVVLQSLIYTQGLGHRRFLVRSV